MAVARTPEATATPRKQPASARRALVTRRASCVRAPTIAAIGAYTAASSASSSAPRPSTSISGSELVPEFARRERALRCRRSLRRRDGCRGVLRRALRAQRVVARLEGRAADLAVDQDRAAVAEGRGHGAVVD